MKESKIQNIIVVVLFCLFLVGPAMMLVGQRVVGLDLPDWFTTAESSYLEGDTTESNLSANLSFQAFASGDFQDSLSTAVGNYIPYKAGAMLGTSALQRLGIASSNMLFGWDCYPTKFGSSYVYIPSVDAIANTSHLAANGYAAGITAFGAAVTGFAQEHPELQVVVYVEDSPDYTAANPAQALMTGTWSTTDSLDVLNNQFAGLSNVSVLSDVYTDTAEYYQDHFRSDHHWNVLGAAQAYQTIASVVGLPLTDYSDSAPIENYVLNGATSRGSLMLLNETVSDTTYDFSSEVVTNLDGTVMTGADHSEFYDFPALGRQYGFYEVYYGESGSSAEIKGSGSQSAVMVADSYGGALKRMLANDLSELKTAWDLHWLSTTDTRLTDYLAEVGASTVIFVADSGDYSTFMGRHALFFQ